MTAPDPSNRCPKCGGRLVVIVEVASRPERYAKSGQRVVYFRCDACNHIQIVEK